MLHWLQQKWNNLPVFLQNFVRSSCIHLVVIYVIFFAYRQGVDLRLSLKTSDKTIVRLLPFGAVKPASIKNKNSCSSSSGKQEVYPKKSCNMMSEQTKSPKKQRKKTALQEKEKKKKKQPIKKKNSQKEKDKKAQVQDDKKNELPQMIKEQQKIEEQPQQKPHVESKEPEEKAVDRERNGIDENVMYVTQQELDALQLQQQLKEALEHVWTAPVGIPDATVCEASVTVGWDGRLVDCVITQESGNYLYDTAVEHALELLQLPQPFWGKTIAITFKP